MERRRQHRDEANVEIELFARGKLRAGLIADVSLGGVLVQVPEMLVLESGETVLVRLYGLASAVAQVRWCEDGWMGLEFRMPLHPSVIDFALREYADSPSGGPASILSHRAA